MDCGIDGLTFTQPSLTRPQFAPECDLRTIIERFMRTGEIRQPAERPTIDGVEGLPSTFEEMMQNVALARQRFEMLPLEERNKYNNDPEAWLQALQEQQNEQDEVEPSSTPSPDGVQEVSEDKQPKGVEVVHETGA